MQWVDHLNTASRRVPTWVVYVLGFGWMLWLFGLALTGRLGVEPIEGLEHRYGLLALQLLVAGLCITPLRRFFGVNLLRFRRAIGLMAFSFVTSHLLVWLVLDVQVMSQIWQDILKRPYITIGMAGFLCLVPLAATSNMISVRRLGANWRRLHLLTYPACVLAAVHFVMLAKGWQAEPLMYLSGVGLLLGARLIPRWGFARSYRSRAESAAYRGPTRHQRQ